MTTHLIPKDWSEYQISDFGAVNPSQLSGKTDDNFSFFYIDLSMVNNGNVEVPKLKVKFSESPSRARRLLKNGDVIMSTVRPNLCGHAQITPEKNDWVCSTGFAVIRPQILQDQPYIYHYLFSNHIHSQINCLIAGSNYPSINASEVEQLLIFAPNTSVERSEISKTLSNWDRAIDLTDRLIAAKQARCTWLMKQLLTGVHRAPDFSKSWTTRRMSELVEPVKRVVQKPTEPYKALGIRSHCKGTFERFVNDPASVDMEELYVAKTGDLIVNITFAWEGAIAFVPKEHDGNLVSHRFPTYRLKESVVDPEFMRYVVTQQRFLFTLVLISPGGAGRNRVMSKRDFLDIEVSVPCLEEQRIIGTLLNLADEEIALLSQQLDAVREQKKGLMQQLLTGKKRVVFSKEE